MRTLIHRNLTPLLLYSFTVLIVDRLLKNLAQTIPPHSADFSFLSFGFSYTPTTNVLGIVPLGSTAAVVLVSVVFVALFVWTLKNYHLLFTVYSLPSFIFFGGFSNLFDRLTTGSVSDVFRIAVGSNAFVFNVADGMIVLGATLWLKRVNQADKRTG